MVESAKLSDGAEIARLCLGKTMRERREAQKGWVAETVPVSKVVLKSIPLSPRFGIAGERNGDKLKTRAIGDFKASRANALISMRDTSIPQSLDVFFGAASMFSWLEFARPLKTFVLDSPPRLQARKNSSLTVGICYNHTAQSGWVPNGSVVADATVRVKPGPRQLGEGYQFCAVYHHQTVQDSGGHLFGLFLFCGACRYSGFCTPMRQCRVCHDRA